MAPRTQVLVPLAPGFEEIEAATIIDVLRRADFDVVVAGLIGLTVTGSHAITFTAERPLEGLRGGDFAAVVLPGGMPGARHLRESALLLGVLRDAAAAGKIVAAVCAAPTALEAAGLLSGKRATSYPGHDIPSASYSEERVVVDGKIVTSRGPGTSMAFALELVRQLGGSERAELLAKAMLVN
jgi:4-methyl-5(b-hydroxyethyl)-thiazole monophosphate biosynthesis